MNDNDEFCKIWGCKNKGAICSTCENYVGEIVIELKNIPKWYGKQLKDIHNDINAPQDW